MINLSKNFTESPFDFIRRKDEGGEFWLGRELMKLMGYTKWQNFEKPAQSAIENIQLTGDEPSNHITATSNVVIRAQNGGSNLADFRMSRYGCYMTALCCDGRKAEVAMAKKYFAIKTREAEIKIPAQSERIRELELELQLVRERRAETSERQAIVTLHKPHQAALILKAEVVQLPPEVIEHTVAVDPSGKRLATFDGVGIGFIRDRYGFRNNAQAWQWLESIGFGKSEWIQELTAVQAARLPRNEINKLDSLWQHRSGSRQLSLGE